MDIQPSAHFSTVSLNDAYNAERTALPETHPVNDRLAKQSGVHNVRGIPFDLGNETGTNVILLEDAEVSIPLHGQSARYLIFMHAAANEPEEALGLKHMMGTSYGDDVSTYEIEYENGERSGHPIRRRFAIQQYNVCWGSSSMASVPAAYESVWRSNPEDVALGNVPKPMGNGECRHGGARDTGQPAVHLYALPNPHPDRPIAAVHLQPKNASSAIFGLSLTNVEEHPLRFQVRRKLLLELPEGVAFNAIDEVDDITLDLGVVISARRQFVYPHDKWNTDAIDVQPELAAKHAVVEYAAHPKAVLQLKSSTGETHRYPLEEMGAGVTEIQAATKPVRIKVIDKTSRVPVGARIHFHGEQGEYLPPKGYHRKVNINWFHDVYGEFANEKNQYAYIHGECILDAPLGTVYVEITRGYEISPVRESFQVSADTDELCFELERVLDWRDRGWVTADTHVHFLSPATAVLEGEAEAVNVVNVLASQWGEMFSNVGDFDGVTNHSNSLSGNNGEFIARVGTENRMQVLGHISLLGYSGEMIHPLCSGGPSESAIGDAQEVTMAQWAKQCLDQNGLVVMPHAPNPQCERAADIVLELVDAMEMMVFNPHNMTISPFGITDWYRFLNLGYQLPVVGGSDKMWSAALLGGIRTYTQLGDREFTYDNWMAATRAGNTFVTVGPLLEVDVDGVAPGGQIKLPEGGGTVTVNWRAASVRVPIEKIEIISGAEVVGDHKPSDPFSASGSCDVKIDRSNWIAVRVRGSYQGNKEDLAAHSSTVQVLTGETAIYNEMDAVSVLRQIEGAMAYVDTLAARPDADRYRKLQLTLESAYNRMHQRMHAQGQYHEHTPMHRHGHEH